MDKVRIEVEIARDVVDKAERLGLQVAAEVEAALRRRLDHRAVMTDEAARRWAMDNADAIAFNNRQLEEHGLWCDEHRLF